MMSCKLASISYIILSLFNKGSFSFSNITSIIFVYCFRYILLLNILLQNLINIRVKPSYSNAHLYTAQVLWENIDDMLVYLDCFTTLCHSLYIIGLYSVVFIVAGYFNNQRYVKTSLLSQSSLLILPLRILSLILLSFSQL